MFYKGKRVLVTGGTGFVGRHIIQQLLKEGAIVRVPVHNRQLATQDEGIETVQADLTRQEDCLSVSRGIDYVFHAAGAVMGAGAGAESSMAGITTNLILTSQILQAAWIAGIERFLLFSSSTGYPVTDYPVKEDEMWSDLIHPAYLGYGWMRRYFERLGEFVASNSDVKISIVRPTAIYGRYDNFDPVTSHVIPSLIRKAVERCAPFEVWGSGQEVRDFLHVSDLARGCLLMIEKNAECDPVNIGYGETVTVKEIVSYILDAAEYVDAKVVFNASKPTSIPFRMVDTSKAKRVLGFEPEVTIEDGIKDTVDWFREQQSNTA